MYIIFINDKRITSKSFTLIELLIVIVIVGILATSLIPRLKGLQDKAKYTAVDNNLNTFRTAVFVAQSTTNKTLPQITINGNTARYCSTTGDLRNLPSNDRCVTDWILTLRRVEAAAGMDSGALSILEKDPRGAPYILDENEGEFGVDDCRRDYVYSVGTDGIRTNVGDNKGIYLAAAFCGTSY